jgi:N-acetylneuraminic acid mutarotase
LLLSLASLAVFAIMATGFGPDRRIRLALGLPIKATPCTPAPELIRNPSGASGSWRSGASLPQPQDEIRAAAGDSIVYLGTGIDLEQTSSGFRSVARMYAFDPDRATYTRLPDVPARIDHPLLAVDTGDLYLVGGYVDGVPTGRTWRFSARARKWSELAPMPTARGGLGGGVIGNRLYAVGGASTTAAKTIQSYRTLEILDLQTGRWRTGPPMRFARHHVGAAALGGSLYVVGGRGRSSLSLAFTERFDPRTGRWEVLPALPQGVGGLAAVAAGGQVVAVGGGDDEEKWVTGAAWALDPELERWRRLPNLVQARHGHGAAAIGARVYVFGGAPCPGAGGTAAVESLDLR